MPVKAIFVCGIDYESPIQIGDHHLARRFALHGWQVAFVSMPITPFHLLSKNSAAIKRKYQNFKASGIQYQIGRGSLWSYVPGALLIPKNNRLMTLGFYKNWQTLIHPRFISLLHSHGFLDVDLIYLRDPLQAYLMEVIEYRYSIYRVADNDAGFDIYNKNYAHLEKSLAQRVNMVLYTAKKLEHRIAQLNPCRTMFFPNGVDLQHFQNSDKSMPPEYQHLSSPIVVYAGTIDYWFDFDLINALTEALPEVSFVIIGPNEEYSNRFIPRSNLYQLGPIEYARLPGYLYNADLGIIPFNVIKYPQLVNAINPIKLYEYLSCGLPVVATKWDELDTLQSPAVLCTNSEEFIQAIRNIRKNTTASRNYMEFVKQFDWEILYKQLMLGLIATSD